MADRQLKVTVVGDTRSVDRALGRTETKMKRFNREVAGGAALGGRGGLFGIGGAATAGSLALGLGFAAKKALDFTNMASDLNEQIGKTRIVFGDASQAVIDFGQVSAKQFGIAESDAVGLASTFGALFRPMGLGVQEAEKQSVMLTKLGADLASFYNTDVADALEALRSGVTGMIRPLRRYGVDLNAARVNTLAMANSGKTTAASLTTQEKVMARLKIITQDTALAQGDFARTSGRLANQQRILKAQVADLETKLGEGLIPVVTDGVKVLNDAATAAYSLGRALKWVGNQSVASATFKGKKPNKLTVGDIVKPFLMTGGGMEQQTVDLVKVLGSGNILKFGETPSRAYARLHPQVGAGATGVSPFGTALDVLAGKMRPPAAATKPGGPFGGAKPLPKVTGLSMGLQTAEVDARIGGNRATLKGVLAKEAQFLQGALVNSFGLKPAEKLALKQALLGVTEEIRSIDDQIIQDANDKTRAAKDAKAKLASAAAASKRKALEAARRQAAALKAQAQAFVDQADAIKSAVLDALGNKESRINNARALSDAKAAMRVARRIGGPEGIKLAGRDVVDAQLAIQRQKIEETKFAVTGGKGGPTLAAGGVTINIHGITDPDRVAQRVIAELNRRGRHTSPSSRGRTPGHTGI